MEKIRGVPSSTARDTTLEAATFRLRDGREKDVAIVHRPDAVVVAPLRRRDDGQVEVVILRQDRAPVNEEDLVELVAGKIEEGEDPLTTAKRETKEEAGLQGGSWQLLSAGLIPASGYSDELIHAYAAFGLTAVERREEDAHIQREWVLLREASRMVRDNEIRELKARDALRTVAERFLTGGKPTPRPTKARALALLQREGTVVRFGTMLKELGGSDTNLRKKLRELEKEGSVRSTSKGRYVALKVNR